jgi:dihydropyrimidine dehydrogenase (NAD+) subunit PreT
MEGVCLLVTKTAYMQEEVKPYTAITAAEEAARCLLCHDAPCSKGCPAGTDPGKFIRSIRFQNNKGAAETIRENNPLGGVCARVCPYDKLCELECSRTGIDRPIEIGRLQRYATDFEKSSGMSIYEKKATKKSKVAIIGAGPAGLACAAKLAIEGYQVTIFESNAKPGGWMTYGIPPARLPQEVVDADINYIVDLGVEIKTNCVVGVDKTFTDLKNEGYLAFFVGVGLSRPKDLNLPNRNLKNIFTAVDFLSSAREKEGDVYVGKKVVVVGGGDVAMDCATTARLLGADKVSCIFVESLERIPASKDELGYTQSLNIALFPCFKPVEFLGTSGTVSGIRAQGLLVDEMTDFANVPAITVDEGSQITLGADMVILAVGQKAFDVKSAFPDINISAQGLVIVDEKTLATNIDSVFAAGDVVNGGKTVVEAVARGKQAAESIVSFLIKREEA